MASMLSAVVDVSSKESALSAADVARIADAVIERMRR